MEPIKKRPNPGSPEAVKLGCKCPVLDNGHGNGYMGMKGVFVMVGNCPIHGKPKSNATSL